MDIKSERIAPAVITVTNNDTGETIVSFNVSDVTDYYASAGFTPLPASEPTPAPTPETVTFNGTEYAANETYISLSGAGITEISPVAGLKDLIYLDLSGNQISDVTPLAGLTGLEFLDLSDNQITDASPLLGLTNLTDLYLLGDNNIPLEQIDALKAALPDCAVHFEIEMTLAEAMKRDDMTIDACGNGINETMLTVNNKSAYGVSILVPFGTYFEADDEYIQSMVVREEQNMSVDAGASDDFYISTACMNIDYGIPWNEDTLTIKTLEPDSRLAKLMKVLNDNGCSYEISQAAVWIATDDPDDDDLLNTMVNQFNVPVINQDQLDEAKKMVALADASKNPPGMFRPASSRNYVDDPFRVFTDAVGPVIMNYLIVGHIAPLLSSYR